MRDVPPAAAAAVVCGAVEICDSLADPPMATGSDGALLCVKYHPKPIPAPMAKSKKMEMHQIQRVMLRLFPMVDDSHLLFFRFGSSLATTLNLRQNSSPFGVFLGSSVSSELPRIIASLANSTLRSGSWKLGRANTGVMGVDGAFRGCGFSDGDGEGECMNAGIGARGIPGGGTSTRSWAAAGR